MSKLLHTLMVVSAIGFPICTQAHMQMVWPYALRSSWDPDVPLDARDYSMTSPLLPDGSNFACKNYQNSDPNVPDYDPSVIKATYIAGQTYNITLAGTATHMGGSCQISLSYDNGRTFSVIESIIGGCPLSPSYDFTIPSFAPSSNQALLSWSWVNLVGNREFYQNCARVQIQGSASHRYRRAAYRRQNSMSDLPDMFVCNVNNGCTTIEGHEVVYPNPGDNVIHGTDAETPQSGPGFILAGVSSTPSRPFMSSTMMTTVRPTNTVKPLIFVPLSAPFPLGNGTNSTGPTGTSPPTTSTSGCDGDMTTTTTAVTTTTMSTTTTTLVTSTITTTSSSSSASPTSTQLSGPCTPGAFACNSLTTFSQCVSTGTGTTSYIYMGSVAAGMQCVDGSIIRQNDGPCTPNGSLFCNGPNAFYMCDQGGLINMGPVAAGTKCENGVITFA